MCDRSAFFQRVVVLCFPILDHPFKCCSLNEGAIDRPSEEFYTSLAHISPGSIECFPSYFPVAPVVHSAEGAPAWPVLLQLLVLSLRDAWVTRAPFPASFHVISFFSLVSTTESCRATPCFHLIDGLGVFFHEFPAGSVRTIPATHLNLKLRDALSTCADEAASIDELRVVAGWRPYWPRRRIWRSTKYSRIRLISTNPLNS
jgi:hypothetical protein